MGKPRRNPSNPSTAPAPRIERKIIEKNRRTKMKILYSKLVSLLPHQTSQVEGAPLPDQIDAAVEYITNMTTKLEKLKQKKEFLIKTKNMPNNNSCITFTNDNQNQAKNATPPLIEVQDMGPNLDVILANQLPNYSIFRDIMRLVHQQYHEVEIASATFARDGHSSIQLLHDKIAQPKSDFDVATISGKLKELVAGGASSTSEVVESQQNLWDFEIDSNVNINWGFDIPEVLLPGLQEFMITMNKSQT